MADISKITLPNKQTYNFKDASARQHSASADTLTKVDVQSGNTANRPYHRFAYVENITGEYQDVDSVFLIRSMYDNGAWGIIKVSLRTNTKAPVLTIEDSSTLLLENGYAILAETNDVVTVSAHWLARENFATDAVQFGLVGVTGDSCTADVFVKVGTYARTEIIRLSSSSNSWEMCSSSQASSGSTNCYSSLSSAATSLHGASYTSTGQATDRSTVNYANSAGNANAVNGHSVGANVPADAAFTDTHKDWGLSLQDGNISIVDGGTTKTLNIGNATAENDGFMAATDKSSLDTLSSTVKDLKTSYDNLRKQFDALAKIAITTEA